MRDLNAVIRQLVVNDRYVLGPDVPAELIAYYGPATDPNGIVMAEIMYTENVLFPGVVFYSYRALLNSDVPLIATGFVADGDVHEYDLRGGSFGSGFASIDHDVATNAMTGSINNLIQYDHNFRGFGKVRFDQSGLWVTSGDFRIDNNAAPRGCVFAESTAAAAAALGAAEAIIYTTVGSCTFKNGRAYEVRLIGAQNVPAGQVALYRARKGTLLAGATFAQTNNIFGHGGAEHSDYVMRCANESGADIGTQFIVTGVLSGGVGTFGNAAGDGRRRVEVWDIGTANGPGNVQFESQQLIT